MHTNTCLLTLVLISGVVKHYDVQNSQVAKSNFKLHLELIINTVDVM